MYYGIKIESPQEFLRLGNIVNRDKSIEGLTGKYLPINPEDGNVYMFPCRVSVFIKNKKIERWNFGVHDAIALTTIEDIEKKTRI